MLAARMLYRFHDMLPVNLPNTVMSIPEKTISKELYDAFDLFVFHTPTQRLSRNLRTLLMEYLIEHHGFFTSQLSRSCR